MKKLIPILLLLAFVPAPDPKPPFVTAEAASVYTTKPVDTLYSTACDPICLPITYKWNKVSGPGVQTITGATSPMAVVSGLQTGWYVFQSVVTSTSGLSSSDTVGFLVNIPIYIQLPPLPPVVIHDTVAAKVIKTVIYFQNGTSQSLP